nr:tetratricopeptide repeat protein [Blautia producta]
MSEDYSKLKNILTEVKTVDKNEYRAKLDVINDLVDRQDYKGALEIVDTIDWRRVRSARTLCMVGEIYEANKRYEDSRKLLILAHQRAPIGKTVIYRLVELAIKMGNFDEAIDYFNQFVEISPNDNSRYILKYKIYRGRRSPIQEQIAILEEYKGREYTERWSYELARLYAKAGMKDKCVEECDDLILWFSEGKYVIKAMELKMKYAPLSPSQEEKYRNRLVESSPEKAAAVAAATITAATQAASKLVSQSVGTGVLEQNTDEMPHIESVRSRATGKAPEEVSVFSPILETTGVLQDKIAKGIRDVFSGGPREEEPETETEETADSAAEDTEDYSIQDDTKDYVVKDLEPDNPASLGSVTPAAKESPVSRTVEAPKPKAVKAQEPVREVDLDAILAETAGELAQAVAKVSEGVAPAGAAVADTHSFTAQNADVTPVTEAEKAEEAAYQIEAAVSEKVEEPVYQTEAAELKKTEEPAYQTEVQEPEKTEEPAYQTEAAESEKAEEPAYQTEAAESERTEEPAYGAEADTQEETVFAEEEIPGQPSMADIMAEAAVTSEADIPDGRTIEIPVEEVRAGLGGMTIDLQKALESAVMEPESPAQTEDTVQSGNVVQSDAMMQSGASVQPEDSENEFIHTVAEDKRMPAEASMSPAGIATESILRHHLTPEEQKRLFTYFAPIPGLTQQITEALDIAQESACAKTSKSGNIVITGREGAGKTRLSEGLIKAICKERHMEGAKIAYLDAQKMNEKDPAYVVDKLAGGFLVVENASSLQSDVIEKLSKAMEFRTNRLTVILEDLKPGIQNLEKMYPEFMEKFDSRVVIPVFTNDELVSFAKTYSKEMGYKIDDMAVLALYTLIGDNQDEDDPVSVGQVKEMMDSAIKRASRGGRRPGKKVAKRHLDESGRIMLYEKDFDV